MSKNTYSEFFDSICRYDADGNRTSKTNALGTVYYKYDSENRLVSYGVTEEADTARLEYDADGNLVSEVTPTKDASYAYNYIDRMSESHVTEIRDGSRQTPKDTIYAYDSFGRRILEADILNRWIRHTEYRGFTMDVWKNAAVHGIKEPRDSRGIDSTGMVFRGMQDFLPAFADFSRASPYDFTHVALTLPLGGAGGEVLGLLQTEHSGIGFNPFVNASHTDAERHYFGKDHLGSVRAVTNQWGSPLYMFDYDVFGQPLQDRPERFRHGFTGKEYDSWTGLYNYGFRDYAPVLGRFTTVDPVQDGHNWYAYAVSDPVSWLDPWGLKGQESGEDKKNTTYNGSFSFDPHNPSRIYVNLDDKKALERAAELLVESNPKYTITAYGEKSGITKNFYSYSDYYYYVTPTEKWPLYSHFEGRDAKNIITETFTEIEKSSQTIGGSWSELEPGLTKYHQNKIGEPERKFICNDGREAVFTKDFSDDGTYQLVTDPRYKGTYNYCNPVNFPEEITVAGVANFVTRGIGHFIVDMLPYYLTGYKNERNQ